MSGQLKQFIASSRDLWDRDEIRTAVRENFDRVVKCRTPALGAEVFSSATETRVVYHTCKSRACPSCGQRATQLWQREQWATMPDVPYAGIVLTMPNVLWPIFKINRKLLKDLPTLGAEVIKQWVKSHYGMEVMVMVVLHTFGGRLNFNPHLHILASAGGLGSDGKWHAFKFDKPELMKLWRFALMQYLTTAANLHLLPGGWTDSDPQYVLQKQSNRWWNIYVSRLQSKGHFLRYAGRYVRRPPLSERSLVAWNEESVKFWAKNHRQNSKTLTAYGAEEFLDLLQVHVPDRYRHAVRYYGLWGPRVRCESNQAIFRALGQTQYSKPFRLRWAASIWKSFGTNPLIGKDGLPLRWSHRLAPAK